MRFSLVRILAQFLKKSGHWHYGDVDGGETRSLTPHATEKRCLKRELHSDHLSVAASQTTNEYRQYRWEEQTLKMTKTGGVGGPMSNLLFLHRRKKSSLELATANTWVWLGKAWNMGLPVTFPLGHPALLCESGDADQSLRSRSSMVSHLVWSRACAWDLYRKWMWSFANQRGRRWAYHILAWCS